MLWLDDLNNEGHIPAIYHDAPGDRIIFFRKNLRTEDVGQRWPQSWAAFLQCAAWNRWATIQTTVNRGATRW